MHVNHFYSPWRWLYLLCTKFIFCPQWYDHDTPESQPFPLKYANTLSDFQKLSLLRCFRIDRIYRAVEEYVTLIMGEKYVTPPIISFESIFEQSTPMSPIVFILSPGSDPASDLMKLAERIEFGTNKLKFLSMGQGQEKVCMCLHFGKGQVQGDSARHLLTISLKSGYAYIDILMISSRNKQEVLVGQSQSQFIPVNSKIPVCEMWLWTCFHYLRPLK